MADLNIRKVDDDLLRRLKMMALERGKTLRDFMLDEMTKIATRKPKAERAA